MTDHKTIFPTTAPDLGDVKATIAPIADQVTDTAKSVARDAAAAVERYVASGSDLRAVLDQAQNVLEDTIDAAAALIRERPLVATAIVGGVAAAATAGAAYGIARLNEKNATAAD